MTQEHLPPLSSRLDSLGQRLRSHRLRLGLSQEALAQTLGVSARSIRRWEQDQAVPQEVAREQLCHVFGIDPRSLLGTWNIEEPTLVMPILWQVPFPRNPFFTGRTTILTQIHKHLSPKRGDAHARSLVLCGLGGIGKTQIALEYTYQYAQEHTAIFWITAETSEGVLADFMSIATRLQLLEASLSDQYTIVTAVFSWLTTHRDWLLIVDNIEEIALVKQVLPAARYGSFLLTTRLQTLGMLGHRLKLEHLTIEEGAKLLLHRAGKLDPEASLEQGSPLDIMHARSITEALDGIPLAIAQAGAYIEEVQCSLDEYFRLYQSSPYFLLNQSDTSSDHPVSVVRTFLLAFEQVQQHSPTAIDFLRLAAFLHADSIPEEIFSLAERIFRETAHTREKVLGPTHPAVAESLQGLALTYIHQQRLNEAEALS